MPFEVNRRANGVHLIDLGMKAGMKAASAMGAVMSIGEPKFAMFWRGTLSPFEAACVTSYVRRGYDVAVYSYEPLVGLPAGATAGDAREIVDPEAMKRFIFAGKANLSHFSDYFRYKLFLATDRIWVDADMLLVRQFERELPQTVLAREWQPSICGAIMRIDSADPHLGELISKTEAAMDRELLWGETGPLLLTKVFGKAALMEQAFEAERFYAIPHDEFWKVFLPECRDECEAATSEAWGVHLWNNIVDTLGIWKKFAPPEGSFLYECFKQDETLSLFQEPYPEKIMKQMVENYRLRKNGEDLGIKQLSTQILPSVRRTIKHYKK